MSISRKHERLYFLDISRAIAILLLLQGHFVGVSLDLTTIDLDSGGYRFWMILRGITAPMFFFISGLTFTYLLNNYSDQSFLKNPRVIKGFKKALELIVWGIVLHVNLRLIGKYFDGITGGWIWSFHVLQSLGVGLVVMIAIYGIHKLLGGISLVYFFIISAILLLCCFPFLHGMLETTYYPPTAPVWIQNVLKGPNSIFPVIPWSSYMLFGGALGAVLSNNPSMVKSWKFTVLLFGTGTILYFFFNHLVYAIDQLVLTQFNYLLNAQPVAHIVQRLGLVMVVLALINVTVNMAGIKNVGLLAQIGKQTLLIYLVHCVVLYGAIFGFGLDSLIRGSLNLGESLIGVSLFILFFVSLVACLNKRRVT